MLWSFLAGLFLPIPIYFFVKRNPRSWLRYIHVPAVLYGLIGNSPYNLCASQGSKCLFAR